MPTFVLVGHCGPDMYLLKSAITRAVPGAIVVAANDQAALASHVREGAILLINRTLDGMLGESGVELIASLARSTSDRPPTMMLISNFEDAQQAAIDAGARPGFGKKDVHSERTAALLREAAAQSQDTAEQ